jgi:hypothetical protein
MSSAFSGTFHNVKTPRRNLPYFAAKDMAVSHWHNSVCVERSWYKSMSVFDKIWGRSRDCCFRTVVIQSGRVIPVAVSATTTSTQRPANELAGHLWSLIKVKRYDGCAFMSSDFWMHKVHISFRSSRFGPQRNATELRSAGCVGCTNRIKRLSVRNK